jgi:hypothetical protein
MYHFSPYHTGVQQDNKEIIRFLIQIFKILTQPYTIIEFLLISKLQFNLAIKFWIKQNQLYLHKRDF